MGYGGATSNTVALQVTLVDFQNKLHSSRAKEKCLKAKIKIINTGKP